MNRLTGTVSQCLSNGAITRAVVETNGIVMTAVLVDFASGMIRPVTGSRVALLFKESETALASALPPGILSIRNRLPCTVAAIEDDGVLAQVHLDFGRARLGAIITSESAGELCLAPGKHVFALIKSTEVMLESEAV